jgi:tRNA (cytidine/uridine-2'-O-)-methyltransferase
MAIALALYQPDIAANTGAMLRLGACLDVAVHLIHPAGFAVNRQTLRRGGLDYVEFAALIEHDSWEAFSAWRQREGRRLLLLTTRGASSAYQTRFMPDDILMLGRESAGVPDAVSAAVDLRLRIPMHPERRSLNVATAASLVLGEALRQTGAFERLV